MNEIQNPSSSEWLAWVGVTVASLAILEHRALRSNGKDSTLSYATRKLVRRSRHTQVAGTAVMGLGAAWFTFHCCWEKVNEDGFSELPSFLKKIYKTGW